jgi:hypothetical protein
MIPDTEGKKQAARDRSKDMNMEESTPSNVSPTNPPPVYFKMSSLPSELDIIQDTMISEATFSNKRPPPAHDEAPLTRGQPNHPSYTNPPWQMMMLSPSR